MDKVYSSEGLQQSSNADSPIIFEGESPTACGDTISSIQQQQKIKDSLTSSPWTDLVEEYTPGNNDTEPASIDKLHQYDSSHSVELLTSTLQSQVNKVNDNETIRQRRIGMFYQDRQRPEHIRLGPNGPEKDILGEGVGAIVTSPTILPPKKLTFLDLPGRSQAFILTLLFWALSFSIFGIVSIMYPLITGAINLKLIIRPKFPNEIQAIELLKFATVIGQWYLPAQLLHFCFGPAGVLLGGFSGIVFSARELGMVGNIHRRLRREHYINYSCAVCGFILSSHAVALGGLWTIYRYSPPICCHLLSLFWRVIPHLLAIYLTSGIQFLLKNTLLEIMMPIAVGCSTIGTALAILFALIIQQLRECLPTDGVYTTRHFLLLYNPSQWIRFIIHPIIWVNICIHSILTSFFIFWISNIPDAHRALKAPVPIETSYQIFLIMDGVGRYIAPLFLDWIFGPELTRLDLLIFFGIPALLLNTCIVSGILHPKFLMFSIHFLALLIGLMSTYMLSVTRATVDNSFFTCLLNIQQTLGISIVLILNHGLYHLPFFVILRIVSILLIGCIFGIIGLWLYYRDFLGDPWGYPQAGILGRIDHAPSSQLLLPSIMIPLWVPGMPEHEKIQQNYYLWNSKRIAPTEIETQNVRRAAEAEKRIHTERERMREVRERVAL